MENPCINCSEIFKKRPRCKSLKCPMYFEHVKEEKKFEELLNKKEYEENK